LAEIAAAANVSGWVAKELFIRMMFGGNIAAWMKDHNISDFVALPPFCHKLHSELADIKEKFMFNPANSKFLNATKYKTHQIERP
jgi:hypothetical protein